MLDAAAKAARSTHRGEALDDTAWQNRYAVLAGCLPEWAADDSGQRHAKEIAAAIMNGQDLAAEATEARKEDDVATDSG